MPKNGRKTKRKNTRRTNRNRKTSRVFRPQRLLSTGFPKTTAVKLKYVDNVNLDAGVATLASHIFRANSVFDPNQTGVGHQPLGFDQWSVFYNHYVVVGAQIKARFHSFSNTTGHSGFNINGIFLSDDTTFSNNPQVLLEQGLTRARYQNPNPSSQAVQTVTKNFSAKKFFNITNITDNVDRLGANVSSNPLEQAYFVVYTGNVDSTVDNTIQSVLVEITYIVIFSEPKELPQS